jgi:hypothetical protein
MVDGVENRGETKPAPRAFVIGAVVGHFRDRVTGEFGSGNPEGFDRGPAADFASDTFRHSLFPRTGCTASVTVSSEIFPVQALFRMLAGLHGMISFRMQGTHRSAAASGNLLLSV